MEKVFNLTKYFFRKNLGSVLAFAAIMAISTIILIAAFTVSGNISVDYDEKFTALDTANACFVLEQSQVDDGLLDGINSIAGVETVETREALLAHVRIEVDGLRQDEGMLFYDIRDPHKLNQYSVVEGNITSKNAIFLSNYTFIHAGRKLGETINFDLDGKSYDFTIRGVLEEMQTGYHSGIISQYLSSDLYHELEQVAVAQAVTVISVVSSDTEKVYSEILKYLNNQHVTPIFASYDEALKYTCLAVVNVIILVLVAFAVLIFITSLFTSRFKIKQSIAEEITSMGVIKALGFTSREIMAAVILPYLTAGIAASIVGIGLSNFVIPILGLMVTVQSGYIWEPHLDVSVMMVIFTLNILITLLFTSAAACKIKKVQPIEAIRGTSSGQHFKNHFEIAKTPGSLSVNLMLKNAANYFRQNLLFGIILLFVTISTGFIGALSYNVNVKPLNFENTFMEEHPSVVINTSRDLAAGLQNLANVRKVIRYDTGLISYHDMTYTAFVAEDYNLIENDLIYAGRNPENSQEVAVGSAIQEKANLKLGDYIELSAGASTASYQIVGFMQSVNYLGEIVELTIPGYERLAPDYVPLSYYVYLEDEEQSTDFINIAKEKYGDDIVETVDYVVSMKAAEVSLVSMISALCMTIIVLTATVVCLILYMLISTIIIKNRRDFGIYKAIGLLSRELRLQLVGGFLPSVIIAVALGTVIASFCVDKMFLVIFQSLNIYKVGFEYPTTMFIMLGAIIVGAVLIISFFLTRKINKISAYALIKE